MNTVSFKSVKEQRDITTNELTGYLVDGMTVPLSDGNRHYQEVKDWIKAGNTATPAFTKDDIAIYNKKQARQQAKTARDKALSELTHTFADGSIVQVRPSDLSTFQLAISVGQDEDWVMADDTVRLLTVAEMTEAMNSGIAQVKAIWNDYTTSLKGM